MRSNQWLCASGVDVHTLHVQQQHVLLSASHLALNDKAQLAGPASRRCKHFVLDPLPRLEQLRQHQLQLRGPQLEEAAALMQSVPDEPAFGGDVLSAEQRGLAG